MDNFQQAYQAAVRRLTDHLDTGAQHIGDHPQYYKGNLPLAAKVSIALRQHGVKNAQRHMVLARLVQ